MVVGDGDASQCVLLLELELKWGCWEHRTRSAVSLCTVPTATSLLQDVLLWNADKTKTESSLLLLGYGWELFCCGKISFTVADKPLKSPMGGVTVPVYSQDWWCYWTFPIHWWMQKVLQALGACMGENRFIWASTDCNSLGDCRNPRGVFWSYSRHCNLEFSALIEMYGSALCTGKE